MHLGVSKPYERRGRPVSERAVALDSLMATPFDGSRDNPLASYTKDIRRMQYQYKYHGDKGMIRYASTELTAIVRRNQITINQSSFVKYN